MAQWATIAHLRASIIFGDTVFYSAQRQVTLNLKRQTGLNPNTCSALIVCIKNIRLRKWLKKPGETNFFRHSRAVNSVVSGGIWPKFKLFQAFIHLQVTSKNEEDQIKNEGDRVVTTFLPLWSLLPARIRKSHSKMKFAFYN